MCFDTCWTLYVQAILDGSEAYHTFIMSFLIRQFDTVDKVPQWALDALRHAGIDI